MHLFKNTVAGKLIFFILLFLFVYPFKMVGLPVSFRVLFSAFGASVLLLRFLSLKKTYFSTKLFYLAASTLSICVMALFSTYIFNQAGDKEFVNFWLSPLICLLSAYFVIVVGMYVLPKLDFILLSKYYVAVVLTQAIVSVLMFINPAIYTALLHIQQMDELDMTKSEQSAGVRLLGIGASFMILGVINCIALLLAAIILKRGQLSKKYKFYLITAYLMIFSIGMMQARTTIIGFLVSLAYLFFSSFHHRFLYAIRGFKQIGTVVLVALLLVGCVFIFAGDLIKKNEYLLEYGFELLVNYQKKGKLESASTNDLGNMYSIAPREPKTLMVGDGKFYYEPGVPISGYYMHTDIGVMRLMFYFGVPGLILFFIYQFLLIKFSFTVPLRDHRFIIFYFFLLVVLWNLKNVMDTNILFTPFCVLNLLLAKRSIIKKRAVVKEQNHLYA